MKRMYHDASVAMRPATRADLAIFLNRDLLRL